MRALFHHAMRVLALGTAVSVTACSSGLLDVSDPTLVQDSDIANTSGANAQRLSVISVFNTYVGSIAQQDGIFSDELMLDAEYPEYVGLEKYLDTHDTASYTASLGVNSDTHGTPLTTLIAKAALVLPAIRAYADTSVRGDYVAQLYALRGYAIIQMAEDLCPGFPIDEVRHAQPYYSGPYTTSAALTYAVATLDTALANVRDSARFRDLARVLKGRALLDLGQYDLAKIAVDSVPTNFTYAGERAAGGVLYSEFPDQPLAVGNADGGTGLRFASANDPRVVSVFRQMRFHRTTDIVSDSLREQQKYTSPDTPLIIASGIEARLIEAEAALHANDPIAWLATLNFLRTAAITPAMPLLTDPGAATRVDTLFKERAFWMYLTGHRVGDMRRLVAQYARPETTVFPQGIHPMGIAYGHAKSLPIGWVNEMRYNPNITHGCEAD